MADIDKAIADSNKEIENGSTAILILIHWDVVNFYPLIGEGEVFSMPTIDFKAIVSGWRDFLLTPPLNGTKIK